jgi:hypothetical protein
MQTQPNSIAKIEAKQRSQNSRPAELHPEHHKQESNDLSTNFMERLEESNSIDPQHQLRRNRKRRTRISRQSGHEVEEQPRCQELKTHSKSG